MTDPFSDLQTLDIDPPSFYDEPVEARNVGAGLAQDRKLVLSHKHELLRLEQVANAAATLERLPAPDETFHIICRGNWPAWALVPAFLRLGEPARIDHLHLATLGFSRSNADELLGLFDQGLIGSISMVISCYFRTHEHDIVDWLALELANRGQRFASVRNHAKVITAQMSDGNNLIVESSANLRSCRNVEQFAITNHEQLLRFHQEWIDTVIAGGDAK
jgi:hypothetical protein